MGRTTDDEILAMRRCAREIEKLEDPRAEARVACYLSMRFTKAIDVMLPQGVDRAPAPSPMTAPSATETADETAPAPADGPVSAPAADPADAILDDPPSAEGWDISGAGSETDDNQGDLTDGDDEEVSI